MSVMDDAAPVRNDGSPLRLCVLASGSAGNCSVLVAGGREPAVLLIDLGLSPRRTEKLLGGLGLSLSDVCGVMVTHFDHDHVHSGWSAGRMMAPVYVHDRHLGAAQACGLASAAGVRRIEERFSPCPGVEVRSVMNAHDESGTAAFRVERAGASLGFATDLGSVSEGLVSTMRHVDVLAIESNYCPKLQESSGRPPFLKERIMCGSGHLSNQQAAEAVAAIEPREHVVFLHLSRECNHPELVARLHEGADYGFTISTQHAPTRWVGVGRGAVAALKHGVALSER